MRINSIVTLDGSKSTDADGDSLTYRWTMTKPDGNLGMLDAADTASPKFDAKDLGIYAVTLIVNDGHGDSAPSTVIVTVSSMNAAPIASAGSAQNVKTGDVVTLDGSASSDADGDALTYRWSLTAPDGSRARLEASTSAHPTFTADVAGVYSASLVVNDGRIDSAPVTVAITATVANAAPVANAGPAQTVAVGSMVTLDGSRSSDADGDALSYSWSLTSKPIGSSAVLESPSTVHPTLAADIAGTYVATLVVNDGLVSSEPATVIVTANASVPTSLALFSEDLLNGSLTRLSWPYTDFRSSGITCPSVCSAQIVVAAFKLRVVDGSSVTITDLEAKNSVPDSPIVPAFDGLREGQVIRSGETASFKLYFDWVQGAVGRLTYTFTVKETGQVFKYDLNLRTY